ncbi:hypothetical protein ACFLXY_03665 [Chloroflexota bacterium]
MAETEKTDMCLNPQRTELPVQTYPLTPRLDILDSKKTYFSITGESDITIPLE